MKKFALLFLFTFSFLKSFAQSDTTDSNLNSFELDSITVSAEKYFVGDPAFYFFPSEEYKLQNVALGEALKSSFSLFIRDYGTGSPQTISYRGLGAENSIVLFNNAAVNDLRTGLFDFSLLNSNDVQLLTFSVSDFASAQISPGGIMNLYSSQSEVDKYFLAIKYGSDNAQTFHFAGTKNLKSVALNFSLNRSYAKNNFDFIFEEEEFERTNSDYSKTFGSLGLKWKNKKNELKFYSHSLSYNNGIPGFVVTNNPASSSARSYSNSLLAVFNFNHLFSARRKLETTISYAKNNLKLSDPTGIVIYKSDEKESKINSFQVQTLLAHDFDELKFNLGYQFEQWRLEGITSFVSSIGSSESLSQNSNRFFASAKYNLLFVDSNVEEISFFGILSHQLIAVEKNNSQLTSFTLGAIGSLDFTFPIKAKINFNSGNRFPNMNERFYAEVFNHYEIKKENYKWIESGIETDLGDDDKNFSLIYFNIWGRDKIFWIPSRLAIQTPRNFASIQSSGFEVNGYKQFDFLKSRINFSYTFLNALNKSNIENDNSFNKNLVYTPQNILTGGVNFSLYNFSVRINSQFVSSRFYTSDNNPIYRLPAYYLTDLHLAYPFDFFAAKANAGISIYNLFDVEYSIIQSFPMPLRTFIISLTMELQ